MNKPAKLNTSPAPWKLENGEKDFVVLDANRRFVASTLSATIGSPLLDEACRNASLIRTAPTMYECLCEAVEMACDGCAYAEWKDGKCKCSCKNDDDCPCIKWRRTLDKAILKEETK